MKNQVYLNISFENDAYCVSPISSRENLIKVLTLLLSSKSIVNDSVALYVVAFPYEQMQSSSSSPLLIVELSNI